MATFNLPPDDSPPAQIEQADRMLRRQLEDVMRKYFYEACDGVTQGLLLSCQWYFTITAEALTLVINCPDQTSNWRILNNAVPLGNILEKFAGSGKIRICPPDPTENPFEMRVDELSIYRDFP